MGGKKLVVISHTAHQYLPNGSLVGWGPTIAELNYLSQFWDELVHVACIEPYTNNPSLQSYIGKNIHFSPIPSFGGITSLQKLSVFYQAPLIIWQIIKSLKGATHVQIRVPMGVGVYVLPLFLFIPRKFILWVKYANNWGHVSNSKGYRLQRWFLEKNFLKCKVTINGFWPNQPQHCLSFENPCVTEDQYKEGQGLNKMFDEKFKIVFAGRLEVAKGVDLLLDIISEIPKDRIQEWVIVGDGPLGADLERAFKKASINARFLGFVKQAQVHRELQHGHFLVLPSKSEGFPKVVAEAWNYRCIPICSAVGSIPHYLENNKNGFLLSVLNSYGLLESIIAAFNTDSGKLRHISEQGQLKTKDFTFNHYLNNLKSEVFNDN